MLVEEQVKLYELWCTNSVICFLTYKLDGGEERTDIVVNVLPMEDPEDDELNYVVHTLNLVEYLAKPLRVVNRDISKRGFELRHVPTSAVDIYYKEEDWLNTPVLTKEVENSKDLRESSKKAQQENKKRSALRSLTIQSLIILLAFLSIKELDAYLYELASVPDWVGFGRDILHKLMVDAGALVTLGIFGSIGGAVFGRMRLGDLS